LDPPPPFPNMELVHLKRIRATLTGRVLPITPLLLCDPAVPACECPLESQSSATLIIGPFAVHPLYFPEDPDIHSTRTPRFSKKHVPSAVIYRGWAFGIVCDSDHIFSAPGGGGGQPSALLKPAGVTIPEAHCPHAVRCGNPSWQLSPKLTLGTRKITEHSAKGSLGTRNILSPFPIGNCVEQSDMALSQGQWTTK